MQTVVSKVLHGFQVQRFYADKFIILLVVRQSETQCVNRFEVCTCNLDFHDLVFVVRLFRCADRDRSGYFCSILFFDAAIQLSGNDGYIVSIDQVVLVDIAGTYIIEVAVTFTQTCVVHVRSQVIAVDLLVVVDIARQVAFCSRYLEDVQFAA